MSELPPARTPQDLPVLVERRADEPRQPLVPAPVVLDQPLQVELEDRLVEGLESSGLRRGTLLPDPLPLGEPAFASRSPSASKKLGTNGRSRRSRFLREPVDVTLASWDSSLGV